MRIEVRNPRTGAIDATIEPPSLSALEETCRRLRSAQPTWAALSIEQRAQALLRLREAVLAHAEAIAHALESDTGRRAIARQEVEGVLAALSGWAAQAGSLLPSGWTQGRSMPNLRHAPQFLPYQLVGVISPWNFPLTLSMIDAIPALLAGSAALIKPSEVTPRFAAPLMQAVRNAGEVARVLDVVLGDAATGAALVERSDAICFTGSVPTGRKVAAACAARMIPAFLELGGKDPMIVLESAPLDDAAAAALRGSVVSTGQACQSIERIYVARPIFEPFVDALVKGAAACRLNWPDITTGDLGPIIFERQAQILQAHLDDARAKGAKVLTGGEIERHGGGLWLRPTILVDVDHTMLVMREETFGPILPVMAFDTLDEAIALANDSPYGLSAAVFAGGLEEAEAVARRIEAGAVSLNDAGLTALFYEAEKHAFKLSGLGGSRMGPAGFQRFLRRKALIANTGRPLPLAAFAEDAPR